MKKQKTPCPFCGTEHAIPSQEAQWDCKCGWYASLTLADDAYLFPFDAAQHLGLNPTEYVAGAGYRVADNPDMFMELRDAGVVASHDEDYYVLQWAKRREKPLASALPVSEFVMLYSARWARLVDGEWVEHQPPTNTTIGRWANERRGRIDWGYQPNARMWLIYARALEVPPPQKGRPKP